MLSASSPQNIRCLIPPTPSAILDGQENIPITLTLCQAEFTIIITEGFRWKQAYRLYELPILDINEGTSTQRNNPIELRLELKSRLCAVRPIKTAGLGMGGGGAPTSLFRLSRASFIANCIDFDELFRHQRFIERSRGFIVKKPHVPHAIWL